MEFVIEQHIRDYGNKRENGAYADSTIKNYISAIRSLHKMVEGKDALFDDLDWARDSDRVLKILESKDNPQTRRNLVNGLIVSLQVLKYKSPTIKPYEDLRDQYNAIYMSSGNLTGNQKTIMSAIKKKDILEFLSSESLDPALTQDLPRFSCFVAVSIHTTYPFRNEMGTMKFIRRVIYNNMKDDLKQLNNWIILENGFDKMTFALTRFKSHKIYGIKEIDVEPKFTRFFLKMCQIRDIKLKDIHGVPVLMANTGDAFNKNKLSKYLSDYTRKGVGHPISTTIMAKMFGSDAVDPVNPTGEELAQMGLEADIRATKHKGKFLLYAKPTCEDD